MVGFAVFASSGGFARGWLVPRGGMGVGDPPTLRANDEHEDWRTPSLNNVKLGTKKNIWETIFFLQDSEDSIILRKFTCPFFRNWSHLWL